MVNTFLTEALKEQRAKDGLLSEESRDTLDRLDREAVWIIDPIDGTNEYSLGRSDWAIHVGLAFDGEPDVGAVALPDRNLVLRSDQPLSPSNLPKRPRLVVSRSRPPVEAKAVAAALDADTIPLGSAGAKAMAVVLGEADIYLHSGGQHEWDSCAPVAIALANGLHCSRLNGQELVYNQIDTTMPDLLICRSELSEQVLAALRS